MKLAGRILLVLFVLTAVSTLMYITWQGHTPWTKIPRSFLSANPLTYKPITLNFTGVTNENSDELFFEDFTAADSSDIIEEWGEWEAESSEEKQEVKTAPLIAENNARIARGVATPSIERCEKILQKLWAKQGGAKIPSIRIANISAFGKPAEFNTVKHEIVIDPKAYQLCLEVSNQKDDALAFLIAHELVHSYQHKEFNYSSPGFFVKSKSLKEWAQEQRQKRKNMETQADLWGAILCYLCGYKVDHIIPDFIENLYTSFNLAEEDPLYDSKKERLDIARRAQKRAKKSIALFDMANYLTLLQEYDKAIYVYDYLIEEFKTAEFYNNRGLANLRIGLGKLGEPYSRLDYPFLLDTETQLDKAITKSRKIPAEILRKSVDDFSEAIKLNRGYPAAYVNRAIAWHGLAEAESLRKNEHIASAKRDLIFVHGLTMGEMDIYTSNLTQIKQSARKVAYILPLSNEELLKKTTRNFRPISGADHPTVVDNLDFQQAYALRNVRFDWDDKISFEKNVNVSGKKFRHSFLSVIETYDDVFYLQKMDQPISSLNTRSSGEMAQVGQSIFPQMMSRLRKSVADPYGNYFLIDDLKGVVYKMSPQHKVLEWVIFGG